MFALVALGGAALTVCLQARRRDVPWVLLGTLLAFGTDRLTKLTLGGDGSPLIAALVLGAFATWQGRRADHAYGTVMIPGLLQLAPGFVGTEAVLALLRGHAGGGDATFFKVGTTAAQLVIGLMLAALIFGSRRAAAGGVRRSGAESARAPSRPPSG